VRVAHVHVDRPRVVPLGRESAARAGSVGRTAEVAIDAIAATDGEAQPYLDTLQVPCGVGVALELLHAQPDADRMGGLPHLGCVNEPIARTPEHSELDHAVGSDYDRTRPRERDGVSVGSRGSHSRERGHHAYKRESPHGPVVKVRSGAVLALSVRPTSGLCESERHAAASRDGAS